MLLTATGLSKSHGLRELFRGVSVSIAEGERIGMIGPNGAGKSTLLRMLASGCTGGLAGSELPDDGAIRTPRGTAAVYVSQRDDFPEGATALSAATDAALACADCHGDRHEAEVLATVILGKIGFDDARMDALVSTLSGGWKKRLSVACALASAGGTPDLLFLDEPTNHLDVEGLRWMEDFLVRGSHDLRARAVIFVTHDRVFLENCATRIIELSRAYPEGTLSVDGNYSEFRRRRDEFLEMQEKAQQSLANTVREDDRWLGRRAKARRTKSEARIADSAERRAELAELSERNAAANAANAGIDFTASGRRTRKLIAAHGISKSLGGKLLFRNLDLEAVPGECIGLMGPNGAGKTTLLRVLTGELAPDTGTVAIADPAPRIVAMSQTRAEFPKGALLQDAISPLGEKVRFRDTEMHVKSWSRRFLFRDEQLLQSVSMLSGGELARAHVARMMLETADVLVLDEPTNDLDIPTLEVLEDAIESFPGATLLVTHDRAMLDTLASRIVVLGAPDGIPRVVASLDQALRALEKFEQEFELAATRDEARARAASDAAKKASAPASAPAVAAPARKKLSYNEQREFDGMESAIAAAEKKAAELEAKLNDPKLIADHAAYAKACDLSAAAQTEVSRLYARWEELEAKRG
ncbi:MAG: ABC-F family ATP-binding cassette domain-containing protein [Planctomycetaceae bacterium]|nr:ABC-F family ATP-binding cassette domain-containing protein [Planctomycetaceae bacterium]